MSFKLKRAYNEKITNVLTGQNKVSTYIKQIKNNDCFVCVLKTLIKTPVKNKF